MSPSVVTPASTADAASPPPWLLGLLAGIFLCLLWLLWRRRGGDDEAGQPPTRRG